MVRGTCSSPRTSAAQHRVPSQVGRLVREQLGRYAHGEQLTNSGMVQDRPMPGHTNGADEPVGAGEYARPMADVRAKLQTHLRGVGAPFLFVGSGMSRRYLGTDDWPGLLKTFAEKTDRDYDYYRVSAEGDLPAIASGIAEAFHPIWWEKRTYKKSRDQWGSQASNHESALKIEVAAEFVEAIKAMPRSGALADELDLLRNAVVDGIITTNYDQLLETLFPEFDVMVGQQDVLFCPIQGIGEIYKIHGSATQPDTLVLTSNDYEAFDARSSYLAAKLMTIFVEHPIVFLGYSISDPNIINILRSISECLTSDNINQLRDRLIFVQWEDGAEPSMDTHTVVLDELPIPVQRIVVPDFTPVFSALASLSRRFPAQMLRKLKRHVYDLVLADDPKEQIVVADLSSSTSTDDLDVVFGVGIKEKIGVHGYVGLTRSDLIDDIVSPADGYDPNIIVRDVLPGALRSARIVPVFKYLRGADLLINDGKVRANADLDSRVLAAAERQRGHLSTSAWLDRKAPEKLRGVANLQALLACMDAKHALDLIPYLPESKVPIEELRSFLQDHTELNKVNPTQYVKVVCFLDWLEFGKKANG